MRRSTFSLSIAGTVIALFLTVGQLQAANVITYIDPSFGSDSNSGASLGQPVKTLADAVSKTLPHGEIFCVSPGSVGTATITDAISIHSPEGLCKIFGTGIGSPPSLLQINTNDVDDVVNIDRFLIDGGNSSAGITIRRGVLNVFDSSIHNSGLRFGINVVPVSDVPRVVLDNVDLTNNGASPSGGGILVRPTGPAGADLTIRNSVFSDNRRGIQVDLNATTGRGDVSIERTTVTGSDSFGISGANTAGSPLGIVIQNSTIANNNVGVSLSGAQVRADLISNFFAFNANAKAFSGGVFVGSDGENSLSGNTANGSAPTGATTQQ
jgi:hypothetical protein